jgi:hypothetical protein
MKEDVSVCPTLNEMNERGLFTNSLLSVHPHNLKYIEFLVLNIFILKDDIDYIFTICLVKRT